MQTTVARWGNSLALRLPKSMTQTLKIDTGTSVEIEVDDGSIVITPSKPSFRLADLLKDYDPHKHRHTNVGFDKPKGEEVW